MLKNAQPETTVAAPAALGRTITTLYAGLAASLLTGVVTFIDQVTADNMTDEIQGAYPDYTAAETATEAGAMNAYLYVMCGLGILGWLWAVWAVRRGARATHVVGTVIVVLALSIASVNLGMPMPDYTMWVSWLPGLVGIVAVVQLWQLAGAGRFRRV